LHACKIASATSVVSTGQRGISWR